MSSQSTYWHVLGSGKDLDKKKKNILDTGRRCVKLHTGANLSLGSNLDLDDVCLQQHLLHHHLPITHVQYQFKQLLIFIHKN